MPFTEATKIEAKRRAHYVCCICHQPFVDVHHILPQEAGGPDTLDNAAPLCSGCHRLYGGNPDHRKQIRQMRDFWWEHCEKTSLVPGVAELNLKFEQLQSGVLTTLQEQRKQASTLDEIKGMVASFYQDTARQVSSAPSLSAITAATGIAMPSSSGVFSGPSVDPKTGDLLVQCFRCGRFAYANGRCQNCGAVGDYD